MSNKNTPTQDPNDPWEQHFEEFKTHYKTDRQHVVHKSAVFDVQELQQFIIEKEATKIAFYIMKHPNPVTPDSKRGVMVAVGFKGNLPLYDQCEPEEYLAAIHNCPDACHTDPIDRPRPKPYDPKPDKPKPDSID